MKSACDGVLRTELFRSMHVWVYQRKSVSPIFGCSAANKAESNDP